MKKQVYKTRQWTILEDNFPELFRKTYVIKKKKKKQRQKKWELYYDKICESWLDPASEKENMKVNFGKFK